MLVDLSIHVFEQKNFYCELVNMGNNYYYEDENGEAFHIGKSSWGWEFSWQAQPRLDVYSVRQWLAFLSLKEDESENSVIFDEYNAPCSFEEFLEISDKREREFRYVGELQNQTDYAKSSFEDGYYKDGQGASFTLYEFC